MPRRIAAIRRLEQEKPRSNFLNGVVITPSGSVSSGFQNIATYTQAGSSIISGAAAAKGMSNHQRTMSNPIVQSIHRAQSGFWGGAGDFFNHLNGTGTSSNGLMNRQVIGGTAPIPGRVAVKGIRSGMTTVGRWMSKGEYAAMKSGTTILEGAGGQTFVTQGGSHLFSGAAKGSVYAEFQVSTNSLLQGGKQGWFKMLGPNASKSQQYILQKQGGSLLPQYKNLSPILKTR